MQWSKLNRTWFFIIGLLIIFSFPTILPLFHHGFFLTDDGEWMIIRFSAFYQALTDGQFPVRFLERLNFEYGYPVPTFLYPGFMYAGIPLHLLRIGLVNSIKIILGGSLVGTTVFIYFWLLQFFKKRVPAMAGAIVSLYLPYHLYDVYTRGSVGEIFALLWVAFIFWMLERKSFLFVSIGIGLLLISHNTIALLFLPFLFLYAIFRNLFSLKKLLLSFLFGILLSAFFTIPAVFELPLTNFSHTTIADPLQYFAGIQLIGISTLVIFFFSLVLIFSKKKQYSDNKLLIGFMLIITFLTIFFSTSFSSMLWQIIPSSFVQFPFRLLSYFVFTTAFLAAFIVEAIGNMTRKIILLFCLAGIVLFSSFSFMGPKTYFDKGEGFYLTNEATTTVHDEYRPVWSNEKNVQRAESNVEILQGKGTINIMNDDNKSTRFTTKSLDNLLIRINTIFWPGWTLKIDGKAQEIFYNNPEGLMEFPVTKGTHMVLVEFGETPLRLVADFISLISLCVLLLILFRLKKL